MIQLLPKLLLQHRPPQRLPKPARQLRYTAGLSTCCCCCFGCCSWLFYYMLKQLLACLPRQQWLVQLLCCLAKRLLQS
jgi:hypothetical protein